MTFGCHLESTLASSTSRIQIYISVQNCHELETEDHDGFGCQIQRKRKCCENFIHNFVLGASGCESECLSMPTTYECKSSNEFDYIK